jgi:hypothetical protein
MTPKQDILNAVQQLPEHTSIEDAMERLFILAKMRKGCDKMGFTGCPMSGK